MNREKQNGLVDQQKTVVQWELEKIKATLRAPNILNEMS